MTEKKVRKISRSLFFAMAALVLYLVFMLLEGGSIFEDSKLNYWDWLITTFQKRVPDSHLVTITIGDGDRKVLGGWPCDHRKLAQIVDFLKDAGAKVIAFDFFFKKNSPGDREFLKAIKDHGNVVIALPWNDEMQCLYDPPESFLNSGVKVGHVAMTKKEVYRFLPVLIIDRVGFDNSKSLKDNFAVPSLALKAVLIYQNLNDEHMKLNINAGHPDIVVDSLAIPVIPFKDDKNPVPSHMIINYSGPKGHFFENGREFNVSQILGEGNEQYQKKLREKVHGNIVLIYNTFDPNDTARTPFSMQSGSDRTTGGEIHAQEISNLLDMKFIRYYRVIDTLVPLFFLVLGMLVFSRPLSWRVRLILFCAILIFWPVISILLFFNSRIVTALWPPITLLILLLIALLYYERRQFVALFGDFVSHRLKDQVLMDSSKGGVGTREVEATIVFADIRGFSTFSEKLSPGELTGKMTEYHHEMNKIFERNHGLILDYLGDAEMIGFGILGEDRYHPLRAIKSGLEMQIEIAKIRERWNLPGGQQFEVGVGICTGMVAEGIVGSEGVKKQLISMGDTTNTAARIQALSKDLDSLVTISESTYVKVKDDVVADPLKEMPLKGKTQKVMLYRIRSIKEEALKRL